MKNLLAIRLLERSKNLDRALGRRVRRSVGQILLLAPLLVYGTGSAYSQDAPWTGQAQCQLTVQSPGYAYQEIQTWTITGPPTQQGAMNVYPGTWSVVGQGGRQDVAGPQTTTMLWNTNVPPMAAPLVVFIRASDNQLLIGAWHSQLRAENAATGSRRVVLSGVAQKPSAVAFAEYEWQFPAIQDVPTSSNVTGSSSTPLTAGIGPMQPAGLGGTAVCRWQFSKGGATPQRTPAIAANNGASPLVTNLPPRAPISTPTSGGAGAAPGSAAGGSAGGAAGAGVAGASGGAAGAGASGAGTAGTSGGAAAGGAAGAGAAGAAGGAAGAGASGASSGAAGAAPGASASGTSGETAAGGAAGAGASGASGTGIAGMTVTPLPATPMTLTLLPQAITAISQGAIYCGPPTTVSLGGQNTNWTASDASKGLISVSFIAGVTANVVSVQDATHLTASVSCGASITASTPSPVTVTANQKSASSQSNIVTFLPQPTLTSLTPASGAQGAQGIPVRLTGKNTDFSRNSTGADFGQGITVTQVNVSNPTNAVAVIAIDPAAAIGPRQVKVYTSDQTVTSQTTFNVQAPAPQIPTFSVTPANIPCGPPVTASVTGTFTQWAASDLSSGALTITSPTHGVAVTITAVTDATHLTANLSCDSSITGATPATITIVAGAKSATGAVTLLPPGACSAGYTSCSGACVNLNSDMNNCGACGTKCSATVWANATALCVGGTCSTMVCQAGYADCNRSAADGCETKLVAPGAGCGCNVAHDNGLGQVYNDCSKPLGRPGNAASYSQVMAYEAASAFTGDASTVQDTTCHQQLPGHPATDIPAVSAISQGSCAVWVYGGATAGYVHMQTTDSTGSCYCPSTTDKSWN